MPNDSGHVITGRPILDSPIAAVNVATLPQRSPLRYPGGKTWLVPHIRVWLQSIQPAPKLLIEPFAGGGVVSLTAVMEGLAQQCLMTEIDPDVAAFWQAALCHNDELIDKIRQFRPTREAIECLEGQTSTAVVDRGFRALALNRTRRGGILADGASLIRSGENGNGLASRWYPETLSSRLSAIREYASRINFHHMDGMTVLEERLASASASRFAVFADPPYTIGNKQAGLRLYNHNDIDHRRLFSILSESRTDFLMTYDESVEILELVVKHDFHAVRMVMQTAHNYRQAELAITRRPVFTGDV